MKLHIVRVSGHQFISLMSNITALNRHMIGGLPIMHTYLPGENVIIIPTNEVAVAKFPPEELLTCAAALRCAMEGK